MVLGLGLWVACRLLPTARRRPSARRDVFLQVVSALESMGFRVGACRFDGARVVLRLGLFRCCVSEEKPAKLQRLEEKKARKQR